MTTDDQLALHPVFADLSAKKRAAIAARMQFASFAAGATIMSLSISGKNAADADVGFILEGKVRTASRADHAGVMAVDELGPGEAIGLDAMIDSHAQPISATALTDVEIALLPANSFRAIVRANTAVALALLSLFARSLRVLQDRARAGEIINPVQRVYIELVRLALPSQENDNVWVIAPMPRHHQLAERAQATEDCAAAAIAHLIRSGIARRRYPALEITAPARLQALCTLS